MPIYEYACTSCGNRVEVMHGVTATGPERCDVCGGSMRKLLSPPAIVFKGSGWAKKDARSPAPARAGEASDGASEAAGKADAGQGPATEPARAARGERGAPAPKGDSDATGRAGATAHDAASKRGRSGTTPKPGTDGGQGGG